MKLDEYLKQNYGKFNIIKGDDYGTTIEINDVSKYATFDQVVDNETFSNIEQFKIVLKEIQNSYFNKFLTNYNFYTISKDDISPQWIKNGEKDFDCATRTYFKAILKENKYIFEPHSWKDEYKNYYKGKCSEEFHKKYFEEYTYDTMSSIDYAINRRLIDVYMCWYEILTTKSLVEILHYYDIFVYCDMDYGMFKELIILYKNSDELVTTNNI